MDAYVAVLRWTLDSTRQKASAARGSYHRVTSRWRDHRMWVMGLGVAAFVATLVDVTGIVIYFSVASLLLKGVLL